MYRSVLFSMALICSSASAQQVPRNAYLDLLPPMPKLMAQTEASAKLALYGEHNAVGYADGNGNGIDDSREEVLRDIADRFSPLLRRNNFSIPVNFRQSLGERPLIHVDEWDGGELVRSAEIPLFGNVKGSSSAAEAMQASAALSSLLQHYLPSNVDARFDRPEDFGQRILFLDFPGGDPKTWRTAYRGIQLDDATSYVHFFIHADTTQTAGADLYNLMVQYWFFYPFNDAANNHEGDWERINVAVTTDSALARRPGAQLDEEELRAILSGEIGVERMHVAFVDYFFHESAVTLDYLAAHRPAPANGQGWLGRISVWRDTSFASRVVRGRLAVANGMLATHPVGFIGGNNKGPDELLSLWPRFRASFNRNSHGTYPFPGIWQSVGPLGSTEHIRGKPVPDVTSGAITSEELAQQLAKDHFITFPRENLILVPDWECIEPLVRSNVKAQQEWSWLVLPLRWGYPATASPGAGALKHVDVGNVAPEGPSFQPGWNRVGTGGWRNYNPDVLRVMLVPTSPFDKMMSGWGFLNLPVAIIGFLPGWNVVATQLMPWVTGTLSILHPTLPRTFRPREAPRRYTSLYLGMYRQSGGNDFALMLPTAADGPVQSQMASNQVVTMSAPSMSRTVAEGFRAGFGVHYGEKVTVENTFAVNESRINVRMVDDNDSTLAAVDANIRTRDLTGGFRYSFARSMGGTWQGFVKAGYGWTWYRVDDLRVNGAPDDYEGRNGYAVTVLPSKKWWPNSWYGGAGIEFFAPRGSWLGQQLGYGVRAEYTSLYHRLGARSPSAPSLGVVGRNDFSLYAVIGW